MRGGSGIPIRLCILCAASWAMRGYACSSSCMRSASVCVSAAIAGFLRIRSAMYGLTRIGRPRAITRSSESGVVGRRTSCSSDHTRTNWNRSSSRLMASSTRIRSFAAPQFITAYGTLCGSVPFAARDMPAINSFSAVVLIRRSSESATRASEPLTGHAATSARIIAFVGPRRPATSACTVRSHDPATRHDMRSSYATASGILARSARVATSISRMRACAVSSTVRFARYRGSAAIAASRFTSPRTEVSESA